MVSVAPPGAGHIDVWWHGVSALPASPTDRAYFALRRVWGDHTMAGARGFYRLASEDHISTVLFHIWDLFPDFSWVASLVRASGGEAGRVKQSTWSYACEEKLDEHLRAHHGRGFVIPDIMLNFSDEFGEGQLTFEAKRPGASATQQDERKLETYCDLPSTRHLRRRTGCFLLGSEEDAPRADAAAAWPVLTWERMRTLQIEASRTLDAAEEVRSRVAAWIARHYARLGIGTAQVPPPMDGARHATIESYAAIRRLDLAESVQRFLLGSEASEMAYGGLRPAPPMDWLALEPTEAEVRSRKRQTTAERQIVRWRLDWHPEIEPLWR